MCRGSSADRQKFRQRLADENERRTMTPSGTSKSAEPIFSGVKPRERTSEARSPRCAPKACHLPEGQRGGARRPLLEELVPPGPCSDDGQRRRTPDRNAARSNSRENFNCRNNPWPNFCREALAGDIGTRLQRRPTSIKRSRSPPQVGGMGLAF